MIAVSPKRLFLLMLVVLLPVQAAAQAKRTANDAINLSASRTRGGSPRVFGALKQTEQDNNKNAQDKPLNHLYVDPQTTLLLDNDGVFLYLGNVGKLKNGNQFPHGTGISRTVVQDPETYETSYEYCLGSWKRGFRHGKSLVKRPDGTYCKTTWRWDNLKSVSEESPSAEEIDQLEKAIARLEKIMSLL